MVHPTEHILYVKLIVLGSKNMLVSSMYVIKSFDELLEAFFSALHRTDVTIQTQTSEVNFFINH